ncbi:MAG: hypothetical protein MEQ84_03420 [Mesorhizobium sp.]|nr:hypothetical protein [Mesorhizobium sp.]
MRGLVSPLQSSGVHVRDATILLGDGVLWAAALHLILALPSSAVAEATHIHFGSPLTVAEPLRVAGSVIANHAFAMAMHRQVGAAAPVKRAALPALTESTYLGPWLWVSANAQHVRKLDDGAFLVAMSEPGSQFHRDIRCWVTQWPFLHCSDGVERKMSAPTREILWLDGVEYRRRMKSGGAERQ